MKAVRFHQCGGPEVLTYEDVPASTAGPGEAVVEIKAVGLNYIDTYHREGLYPVELPCTPGWKPPESLLASAEKWKAYKWAIAWPMPE